MKAIQSIGAVAGIFSLAAAFVVAGGGGTTKTQKINLKVEGMTCAGCARHVESAVKRIQGVDKVKVAWEQGRATVELKNDSQVTPDSLAAAITRAGYKASVLNSKKDAKDDSPSAPSCCRRGSL